MDIMNEVKLSLYENGNGHFFIMDGEERIAEMEISITGNDLTVYHTEVLPKGEGKGLAKLLLAAMAEYTRKNKFKVIALCPFVLAQFNRHPEIYTDIWKR
ncbi:MAG: N-acetyltransferase [Bacteroidota bacterium]|nr:N-acetyltransferase [Bacteroidota bacterium]